MNFATDTRGRASVPQDGARVNMLKTLIESGFDDHQGNKGNTIKRGENTEFREQYESARENGAVSGNSEHAKNSFSTAILAGVTTDKTPNFRNSTRAREVEFRKQYARACEGGVLGVVRARVGVPAESLESLIEKAPGDAPLIKCSWFRFECPACGEFIIAIPKGDRPEKPCLFCGGPVKGTGSARGATVRNLPYVSEPRKAVSLDEYLSWKEPKKRYRGYRTWENKGGGRRNWPDETKNSPQSFDAHPQAIELAETTAL